MTYNFYVGTYTDDTKSEGIYHAAFNATEKTVDVRLAAPITNPSYLAVLNGSLYAAGEFKDGTNIASYHIVEGGLQLIESRSPDGSVMCHLSVHEQTGMIFASCLLSGSMLALDSKTLEVESSLLMPRRNGKEPLAHCAVSSPDGSLLAATDMGGDTVYLCSLNNGMIDEQAEIYAHEFEPGSGPRHLVFHPSYDILYTANELDSTVSVLSLDRKNHKLQTMQTLTAGDDKPGVVNYPASIAVTGDGRFVLVSNRGLDTVRVFSVSGDGLKKHADYPCYGKWPRHIALTEDMRYIIISNQHTDNVAICEFDLSCGSISQPVCQFKLSAPSCVVQA